MVLGSGLNPKCSLSPWEWPRELITKNLWGRECSVVCLNEEVWVEKGKKEC